MTRQVDIPREVDEVLLGLDEAIRHLEGVERHSKDYANQTSPCSGCRSLYWLNNARKVYLKRAGIETD